MSAFLIMPVQRIPRYELLFRDVLKHTDPHDPEAPLLVCRPNPAMLKVTEALERIVLVAQHVDKSVRGAESVLKVAAVQEKLTGFQVFFCLFVCSFICLRILTSSPLASPSHLEGKGFPFLSLFGFFIHFHPFIHSSIICLFLCRLQQLFQPHRRYVREDDLWRWSVPHAAVVNAAQYEFFFVGLIMLMLL